MSEARVDLLSDRLGTGPAALHKQWASKAWVRFNGAGTAAIGDSENTSSLTDNGTGLYTVNLSSAMGNTSYSITAACKGINSSVISSTGAGLPAGPHTSTSAAFSLVVAVSATAVDPEVASAVTHGDLA